MCLHQRTTITRSVMRRKIKPIILAIVIVGVTSIVWVFGLKGTLDFSDRQQIIAGKSIKAIVEALNTKDADLLKSVFSEQALEDAYNMDEGIEYIFSLYEGECEKVEQMPWASGTDSFGKASVMLGFDLMFDGKKFELYYSQTTKNMGNKKAIGIKYMSFLPADFDDESISNIKLPGIYNPVWDDYYINEWSSADSEKVSELKEMMQKDDAIGVVLQGSQYNRIEDLYSDISTQLRFPQTATNLDEFCDEIEDLSWLKQEKIIILLYTVPNMLEDDKNAYKEFANEFRGIMKKWEGHPRDNRADQILARSIDLYMVSSRESGVGG